MGASLAHMALGPMTKVTLRAARVPMAARSSHVTVSMSAATSASTKLAAAQAASVAQIEAARNMVAKDYPAEMGFPMPIGDGEGTLSAFEAPGKDNVAWCSALNIAGSTCLSSLTLWCGPIYGVPHLITRTVVTDTSVDLFIDFRPRAYAAYETRQEDGGYGEPTSREWFGYSSARAENEQLFFTPEVASWADGVRSQGEAKPKATGDDLLYRGPLAIDISLPASDSSVDMCAKACSDAADIWLKWCDETEPLPAGMKVTSTYAYDTKMRAQMFGVMREFYDQLYAGKGQAIAAADCGPLDEAYVGGGS